MDTELRKALYTSAQEQHDRVARWGALALLLAAMFHLVVFSRYVDLHARIGEAGRRAERLKAAVSVAGRITGQTQAFGKAVDELMRPAVAAELALLRADFIDLSASITRIQSGSVGWDDMRVGGTPRPVVERAPTGQLPPRAAVTQAPPSALKSERWNWDRAVFDRVADRSRPFSTEAIVPMIRVQLIRPRFESLNARWAREVVAQLEALAGPILAAEDELRRLLAAGADAWKPVIDGVRKTLEKVKAVRFEAPENDAWWTSVQGKQDAFDLMINEIMRQLESDLKATAGASGLAEAAVAHAATGEAELKELTDRLTKLEESFASQADVLAGLGEPFKFLAADLTYVVTRFPMLVGVLYGAAGALAGLRLAALVRAARQVEGSSVAEQVVRTLTGRDLGLLRSAGPRALVGCAWVAFAVFQLRTWPGEERDWLLVYGAIGLAAVVAGELFRSWTLARAAAEGPAIA